jgi:hypothetical protein
VSIRFFVQQPRPGQNWNVLGFEAGNATGAKNSKWFQWTVPLHKARMHIATLMGNILVRGEITNEHP